MPRQVCTSDENSLSHRPKLSFAYTAGTPSFRSRALSFAARCAARTVAGESVPPSKVAFLAWHAWRDAAQGPWPPQFPDAARHGYDLPTVRKWLRVFLVRFFAMSQFKRSALPNSPKVVSGGSLSPRGDWRAPSDGNANVWLAELDAKVPQTES